MILNVAGVTTILAEAEDVADALMGGQVRPARVFKAVIGDRHTPQTPYLDRLGMQIQVETITETINAHLLDRDPAVAALVPQGMWIQRAGAHPGWACPDFLVLRTDGTIAAVEVKTHSGFAKISTRRKLGPVGAACHQFGMSYEVRCELIGEQSFLYARLFSLGRPPLPGSVNPAELQATIVRQARYPLPFSGLRAAVDATRADFMPEFWRLCWMGRICVDWEQRFTDASVIRAHGSGCSEGTRIAKWSGACGPNLEAYRYTRRGFVA